MAPTPSPKFNYDEPSSYVYIIHVSTVDLPHTVYIYILIRAWPTSQPPPDVRANVPYDWYSFVIEALWQLLP